VALMIESAKTTFGVKPAPNAIKAMLQVSAFSMSDATGSPYSVLAQGAGALNTVRVTMAGAPDISAQRAVIRSAFEAVEIQFKKKYRDLYHYRLRISYLLLAILVIQEMAWFLVRKVIQRHRFALRTALSSAWLIMGAWIIFVYLER